MRTVLALGLLVPVSLAAAADLPAMRPGRWVFTREAPPDPIYDPGRKPVSVTDEECVEDPRDFFADPNNELLDLCNYTALKKDGATYTTSSTCSIPMWRAKLDLRSVTTVKGAVGYETRFEAKGTVDGRPAHWAETIIARRLGDCRDNDSSGGTARGGAADGPMD